MNRYTGWLCAALVASAAAGCAACRGNDAALEEGGDVPASVSVEVARVQTLRSAVTGPGITAAAAAGDWVIHAAETGRIAQLAKREGEAVETGDVLVRFEYASSQAPAARELELAGATSRLSAANSELKKVQPLFERGYASRAEFEAARSAVTAAELEVTRITRLVEAAAADADRAVIRARFDGVVAKVFHNEGDLVNGSMLDPVMRVIDPTQVEVAMSVQLQDLALVQLGQAATVLSAAGPEPAVVTLRPTPTDPRAVTQEIRLAFVNSTTLPLDSPVSVDILLAERPGVIALPASAILRDGDTTFVMAVTDDGLAERREVQVGLFTRDRVEIVSGVAAGDRVVIEEPGNIPDGSPVVADK